MTLLLALILQVSGFLAYTRFVWWRHRMLGSGVYSIMFGIMALRRVAGWAVTNHPEYAAAWGPINEWLPVIISVLVVVGAVRISYDLSVTRKKFDRHMRAPNAK